MRAQAFVFKHKGEEVNVTMEFPKQSDKAAELEFIGRCKAICLESYRANMSREKGNE